MGHVVGRYPSSQRGASLCTPVEIKTNYITMETSGLHFVMVTVFRYDCLLDLGNTSEVGGAL